MVRLKRKGLEGVGGREREEGPIPFGMEKDREVING